MNPRVLIAPAPLKKIEHVYGPIFRAAGLEMVFPERNAQMTEAELKQQLVGCSAAMAGSETYTPDMIAEAAKHGLRVIARAGVGYDAVDLKAATEHGVVVTFAPGTNQDAVAEHTFSLILAVAKNVVQQNELVRQGQWPRRTTQPLRGRTIGLVGLGRIGKAVALLALAFKMKVVALEPKPDMDFVAAHGISLLSLDELMRQADWVSLHLPMVPEGTEMINARTLALMKPTAYLVNTARGGLVNEADLFEALKTKRIAGAALDVFVKEPPVGSPLLALDNVLATAHTAGVDATSAEEMARLPAHAIVKLLAGEWPADWVVNPQVKEKFFGR